MDRKAVSIQEMGRLREQSCALKGKSGLCVYKLTRGQDDRLGTGDEHLQGQWEDMAWDSEPWSSGDTQQQPLVTDWIWAVNEEVAGLILSIGKATSGRVGGGDL